LLVVVGRRRVTLKLARLEGARQGQIERLAFSRRLSGRRLE
jgi:hypothetical protein